MDELVITLELASLAGTGRLGMRLGELAEPGDVILLNGPLGAGKTTLAQFIGTGLAVPPECYISSPTFSLMHEYPGRLPMYHIDLYRLGSEEEIEDLGLVEYIYGDGLSVIEWPDRLGTMRPTELLEIDLEMVGTDRRRALVRAVGSRWLDRLGELAA